MTTPLRRRMIEDMQVRNLSPVTQRCYVHAVAKFARHFNRSPDRLMLEEIRAYQVGHTTIVERIPYARKRRQLPVILIAEEVVRFFSAVPSLKHRTALMTAYAAG